MVAEMFYWPRGGGVLAEGGGVVWNFHCLKVGYVFFRPVSDRGWNLNPAGKKYNFSPLDLTELFFNIHVMFFVWLVGLWFYVQVNNYGHVETVS